MVLTAEVNIADEKKPEDNKAEALISVVAPSGSAPTNLTAQEFENGVELNWVAPEASGSEVFESFEDAETFPEFSAGGVNDDQRYGAFGEWTLYDGNGQHVYGFPGAVEVPGLGNASAWVVMNPSSETLGRDVSEDYGAHTGSQYLISMCPSQPKGSVPAADHWLISPQVSGTAQTISFYVRSLVSMYGDESYEVLASSTDNAIESFELVAAKTCSTTEWEEVTVDLPEGTQYFAIRHTSPDIWGMMLDDITYQGQGAELASFNIYFQGELVGSVAGDVTTYTVAADKLVDGKRMAFDVTAVYTNGVESLPATAVITITTDIRQISADGQPVDIYTIDGRLVRSQAKSLEGLRGVYVVNGQKYMLK